MSPLLRCNSCNSLVRVLTRWLPVSEAPNYSECFFCGRTASTHSDAVVRGAHGAICVDCVQMALSIISRRVGGGLTSQRIGGARTSGWIRCPGCGASFDEGSAEMIETCDPGREFCSLCRKPAGYVGMFMTGQNGAVCVGCLFSSARSLGLRDVQNGRLEEALGSKALEVTDPPVRGTNEGILIFQTEEETDMLCPSCSSALLLVHSRRGDYIRCSGFPRCKLILNTDGSPWIPDS
jgi:hypothetical protein